MIAISREGARPLGHGWLAPAQSLRDRDLQAILLRYRKAVAESFRALLPEELQAHLPEGPMHVSPKIDGELWFLILDCGEALLANPAGRLLLGDLPVLAEARRAAARAQGRTLLAGELYVTRDEGRARVGDICHIADGGAEAQVGRLHFAAFDLIRGGDAQAAMPIAAYAEKLAVLDRLLCGGERLHPVPTERALSAGQVAGLFEKHVQSGKYEGLVVRSDTRISKVKPSFTVDAAVIGYTEREEDRAQVSSVALALMRSDGNLQYLGNCGSMPDLQRVRFMQRLQGKEVRSNWRVSSSDGALFRFVRPEIVIECKAKDVQAETSTGQPIERMVLTFDPEGGYRAVRKLPCASLLFPVFERIRDDKGVNPTDIRLAQILDRTEVQDTQVGTPLVELPKSEVIRREVYTKTMKGTLMVRKLVVWRTNKASVDPKYPAFVAHWTDYSCGRKEPLQREVRLAPDEATIQAIALELLRDNVKRGWNKVG